MKFTKQEYADLHLLYGETRGNSRPARLPSGERFPEGVLPSRCIFVELHLHLCEVDSDHSHLYLQAVKLKLATLLSRLQVGLRARPLKAPYLVNSFFGR
jgi:hypothetical protein